MAFSGGGSGTTIYPYEITTASQFREMNNSGAPVYYKLMNNIDYDGGAMSILNFGHYLSGCNYSVYNISQSGANYGFQLLSGCTIIDIKLVTKGTSKTGYLLGNQTTAVNFVTLRNIHIKSITATLTAVATRPFSSGCTISNFIIEGKFDGIFNSSSAQYAVYEDLKVLRTSEVLTSPLALPIVYSLGATARLYRSQQIFPNDFIFSGNSAGFLTNSLSGTIEQSFLKFKNILGDNTGAYFQMLTYTMSATGRVKDSYAIGDLFNAKQSTSGYLVNFEPSAGAGLSERVYYSGNIFRHNFFDSGVTHRASILSSKASYTYYRKDLLSGFTATNSDILNKQSGLTKEEFSGTTSFATWDFNNVWLSGETPTLIYNQEYTNFDWYTEPRVIIKNITRIPSGNTWLWESGYTSTGFSFSVEVANVPEWGVEILEGNLTGGTLGTTGITIKYNEIESVVDLPESRDYVITLRPFWVSGGTTGYTNAEPVVYYSDYKVEASNVSIWNGNNVYRLSGTTLPYASGFTFNITTLSNLLAGETWGTEVWDSNSGGTLLYSLSGSGMGRVDYTLSAKTSQWFYIKFYYIENGIIKYSLDGVNPRVSSYFHWWWDGAVTSEIKSLTNNYIRFDTPGSEAAYIHGSCYHNGYIYGSTRSLPSGYPGRVVKVNANDYSDRTALTIIVTGATTGYTNTMEQIKYCNGFLWTIGNGPHLIRINPTTMQYDATYVNSLSVNANYPIHSTNDRYIYMHTASLTKKFDTNFLTGVTILSDCSGGTIVDSQVAIYDSAAMGYYLENTRTGISYTVTTKGNIHSVVHDEQYIYLTYTTGNELPFGANTPDMMVHEIHKVDYNTMSGISYCRIPKTTDDMAQNKDWLFCGVETQEDDALAGAAGAYINMFAINKSTMQRYNLPRFSSADKPPVSGVTSYATLVFGKYVICEKTDNRLYVVDVSDVTGWTMSATGWTASDDIDIGRYTVKTVNFQVSGSSVGVPPNELIKDPSNNFHAFFWYSPSRLGKFRMDDLDFTVIKYGTIDVTNVYRGSSLMSKFYLTP